MLSEKIEFFIPLEKIPTVTHQEKKITVVNGKPIVYESQKMKNVRLVFEGHLFSFAPETPLQGPIRLTTKWIWPKKKRSDPDAYKTTKPDTDNLIKAFKDCMTKVGFWKDDAQVASEITEKIYGNISGIYVKVECL